MTLQLLHSDFLIYEENFIFFFISVVSTTQALYGKSGTFPVTLSLAQEDTSDRMFSVVTGEGPRVAFFPQQIDIVQIGAEDKLTMK